MRTSGSAATREAASEISGERISALTSRPSSRTLSPSSIRASSASRAGDAPGDASDSSATQRYIAPLSR